MQVKISDKILSIIPYISTSWSHISALHVKEEILSITLKDSQIINVPDLDPPIIEQIFNYHAAYLDKNSLISDISVDKDDITNLLDQTEPSFRLVFGSLDGLGSILQHNAEQIDGPDLPPQIMQKIHMIAKMINLDAATTPKAEPFCNCFHCQIARALEDSVSNSLNHSADKLIEEKETVVEQDLQFQQWDIEETGDQMFIVSNRLDHNENYKVYLGEPLGCTCGKEKCEHILAVLRS